MTKQQLQQELLEKVKEGVKPSDLKRLRRIIKSDDGYESSSSDKSIPTAPLLPNQNLQAQIQVLQKQLQLYKDFKETDLRIKEGYKETISKLQAENQNLTKTIEELKNQAKTQLKDKEPIENPADMNMNQTKTFTCSECSQTKSHQELSRVFGKFSFCLECSKQARLTASQQKQPPIEEFICHLCSQGKKAVPVRMKLDSTLSEYLICQECKPLAKEFNEADLITDDLWEKYPYSSASEILELEFGIKNKKLW